MKVSSVGKRKELSSVGEGQQTDPGMSICLATFDQYRSLLFSIAYRMLGSVADAEDMLQETFIRWQQSSDTNIASPRAFLVTIVSRICINHLQSARVKREEYVGEWLPEPIVTDPGSDPFGIIKIDESLSMAFLVLLERLTPIERAVFLLREVFDSEYSDIGNIVGQTKRIAGRFFDERGSMSVRCTGASRRQPPNEPICSSASWKQ